MMEREGAQRRTLAVKLAGGDEVQRAGEEAVVLRLKREADVRPQPPLQRQIDRDGRQQHDPGEPVGRAQSNSGRA